MSSMHNPYEGLGELDLPEVVAEREKRDPKLYFVLRHHARHAGCFMFYAADEESAYRFIFAEHFENFVRGCKQFATLRHSLPVKDIIKDTDPQSFSFQDIKEMIDESPMVGSRIYAFRIHEINVKFLPMMKKIRQTGCDPEDLEAFEDSDDFDLEDLNEYYEKLEENMTKEEKIKWEEEQAEQIIKNRALARKKRMQRKKERFERVRRMLLEEERDNQYDYDAEDPNYDPFYAETDNPYNPFVGVSKAKGYNDYLSTESNDLKTAVNTQWFPRKNIPVIPARSAGAHFVVPRNPKKKYPKKCDPRPVPLDRLIRQIEMNYKDYKQKLKHEEELRKSYMEFVNPPELESEEEEDELTKYAKSSWYTDYANRTRVPVKVKPGVKIVPRNKYE
jgi:hypothetical protein